MSAAHDVETRTFSVTVMGYDRHQVDDFREEMAATVGKLRGRIHELEEHLREHQRAKPITANQAFANVARETQRILAAAQEAGARIMQQAREEAEREVVAARQQHSQIVGEGYRAREEVDEQIHRLDEVRTQLLQQLHEAGSGIERVCAALESGAPAPDRIRRPLSQSVVEHERTGTDQAPRPSRTGERALRVVGAPRSSDPPAPAHQAPDPHDVPRARAGGSQRAGAPATSSTHFSEKRDRLAPLRAALTERLRRELLTLRDDVRERLRQAAGGDERSEAFGDTELVAVARAGRGLLAQAFERGADAAAQRRGLAPAVARDTDDSGLLTLLDKRIGTPVRTLIEHSLAAEDPPWVVAERVEGIFADAAEAIVVEISDTELSRAYERGMLATWSEGDVTARRWIVSPQGHRRDERCHRNVEAGAVAIGEPFPSGDSEPPRFSGCTCTTVADQEENDP